MEQDPRVIQYSKHVRLVFSVMNQDTADGGAYDSSLIHALANANDDADNPITKLRRELSDLHDFHVDTQVQWFAPLHFQPTQEIFEEIVEGEVEEEVIVDEEIEEEVEEEVEVDDEDEPSLTGRVADDSESEAEPSETSSEDNEREESEVEGQLQSAAAKAKRTKLITVKRKRIIQVPELQRVVKQTRTRLPPRYVVEWDDLKVFVNSEEWSLTSTVPPTSSADDSSLGRPYDVLSQTHDLHFLLYIPSKSHSPLLIRDTVTGGVNEASNAWLIPQWGGVVILNVDDGRNVSSGLIDPSLEAEKGRIQDLPQDDVQQAISLFAYQLEILLGLGDVRLPARSLHRRVQLSTLKQRRILELARESTSALLAITRLVSRIENLGVGPDVTADTKAALTILESLAEQDLGLDDMLARVKEAHALSNRAFFNPDMLGLLYFPDEHKYAVYTPLFAPLLVPLLVTSVKLAKEVAAGRKKVAKGKGRRST
uniref:GPI transamidase component PIG-S n=2 Tax=Kalmanozyma brasiliensis (strain GHG001) TaxID=1365824 RepID=V5GNM4_KALBG